MVTAPSIRSQTLIFFYVATQLGLDPAHCVVVENAAVGIEVAIAAKTWTIGMGPVNRFGSAHMVLPSLMDVHLADLQTKLGKYLDN